MHAFSNEIGPREGMRGRQWRGCCGKGETRGAQELAGVRGRRASLRDRPLAKYPLSNHSRPVGWLPMESWMWSRVKARLRRGPGGAGWAASGRVLSLVEAVSRHSRPRSRARARAPQPLNSLIDPPSAARPPGPERPGAPHDPPTPPPPRPGPGHRPNDRLALDARRSRAPAPPTRLHSPWGSGVRGGSRPHPRVHHPPGRGRVRLSRARARRRLRPEWRHAGHVRNTVPHDHPGPPGHPTVRRLPAHRHARPHGQHRAVALLRDGRPDRLGPEHSPGCHLFRRPHRSPSRPHRRALRVG